MRIAMVVPEVIVWWYLLVSAVWPGLRYCLRERLFDVFPLLMFLIAMGLLYSMMFSNVGLVFRHRAQLLPWLLVFASVGIELRHRPAVRRPIPATLLPV